MPISRYFKGSGEKVMSNMKKTYKDPKKAKEVFYATANKEKQKPKFKASSKAKRNLARGYK